MPACPSGIFKNIEIQTTINHKPMADFGGSNGVFEWARARRKYLSDL